MKILVTGGAGYIGGHFVNRLRKLEYEILVVDNFSQGKNNIIKGVNYSSTDIREKESLQVIFDAFKPDIVVHFAAIANVQYALTDPAMYYENNVVGTLNILDCMRQVGCNKIIFSSTSAVYDMNEGIVTEDSLKKPTTAYGYTKLVCEEILKDYHKAYGINSIAFRYFPVVGVDENQEVGCYHLQEFQLMPNLIKAILGKQQVFKAWGNDFPTPDGTAVRDYLDVRDIAEATLLAMNKLEGCHQYNLCMGEGYSVLQMIQETEKVAGKKLNWEFGPRRPGDVARQIGSRQKVKRELGWTPLHTDMAEVLLSDYNFFKSV